MIKKIIIICSVVFVVSVICFFGSLLASGDDGIYKIYNIDDESSYPLENIEMINIESTIADISFYIESERSDILVKYHGYVKCLMCKEPKRMQSAKNNSELSFKARQKLIQVGLGMTTRLKLDVYLPQTYIHAIDVNSTSGDIYLNGMSLDGLYLSSLSGKISLNDLTINKGKITITSGEVELSDFTVNDELKLSITSGEVNIDNFHGNLDYSSLSGELEVKGFNGNFTGRSRSGDIELEVVGSTYDIDINVTSGDVDLYIKEKDFTFVIDVTSGDIDIHFNYETLGGNDSYHYKRGKVGNGTNTVNIKATSGDIDLK